MEKQQMQHFYGYDIEVYQNNTLTTEAIEHYKINKNYRRAEKND